jgi:[ribosomal protein S5]-alanine N-acetyltransferase
MAKVNRDNCIELRKLLDSDAQLIVEYVNNPKILSNLRDNFPDPYLMSDALDFIQKERNELVAKSFVVTYNNDFAGVIGLEYYGSCYKHSAELGFWLGEPYWEKGIGRTAVQQMLTYSFQNLDLSRIFCKVFEYNRNSIKLLTSVGFELEGIGKKAIQKNGKLYDEYLYAILSNNL